MKKIINPSKYYELLHFFFYLKVGRANLLQLSTTPHCHHHPPPTQLSSPLLLPSITLEDNKSVFLLSLHQPSYD